MKAQEGFVCVGAQCVLCLGILYKFTPSCMCPPHSGYPSSMCVHLCPSSRCILPPSWPPPCVSFTQMCAPHVCPSPFSFKCVLLYDSPPPLHVCPLPLVYTLSLCHSLFTFLWAYRLFCYFVNWLVCVEYA